LHKTIAQNDPTSHKSRVLKKKACDSTDLIQHLPLSRESFEKLDGEAAVAGADRHLRPGATMSTSGIPKQSKTPNHSISNENHTKHQARIGLVYKNQV
jgi:hypothetical protein